MRAPMRSRTGMVALIMMGGPITSDTAPPAGTCARSKTVGTKPISPLQSGVWPPGSTHWITCTRGCCAHWANSSTNTRSPTVPRAVDHGDVAKVRAVFQGVPDGAADGRHGDSAAEKDQVLAAPLFHGIAVTIRAAEADC